ncbi:MULTISPECIES: helix-turn-helix domain-containing protein [Butyricimonas]|jgi:putative transcriptional regulator, araC family|uniref:AraC family transcriptional regulator n=1 Tax=Butyricimonas hominis TaxID=2763032 RepID=A0ABR7D3A8_9BACT|nr:helix-turn-helix domain-containing protein [Butyricimonas hominis]MBC5622428.1 AraC family transcriptional regulator [Butyricimonas hominis]
MKPFYTTTEEPLVTGTSDLNMIFDRPYRLDSGLILFCREGTAEIEIDLKKYPVVPNAEVVILPATTLSLNSSSPEFRVDYIAFSKALMDEVSFRLEAPFFGFLKEHPVCSHAEGIRIDIINELIKMVTLVYHDRQNTFRNPIIKNLLQCFFLNMYDKTQKFFASEKKGHDRAEEIFHGFISLVQKHYLQQKEVTFYADELCISPRYLTAITRKVTDESAKEIIDKHVILEIKVLLQSTEMTIQEISNHLNFPNQSYLSRYFKRHTGKNPVDYRDKKSDPSTISLSNTL